jgi:diaminopimelate epimerase
MTILFSKMHGLGNDFVIMDAIGQKIDLSAETVTQLAHRHRGIGFDQLLLLQAPQNAEQDFFYRIFNADGSEAYQCGNGVRCLAQFIQRQQLADKNQLCLATEVNQHQLIIHEDGQITVDMGIPILDPQQIPFESSRKHTIYTLSIKWGDYQVSVVSMGNPHCIFTINDIHELDLNAWGEQISSHPRFPERTNVDFMQIKNRHRIDLRIYERGVGETQACGSGACAAVVAGILQGQLDKQVTVTMPGGDLQINWPQAREPVWMTGPAQEVFTGEIDLNNFT